VVLDPNDAAPAYLDIVRASIEQTGVGPVTLTADLAAALPQPITDPFLAYNWQFETDPASPGVDFIALDRWLGDHWEMRLSDYRLANTGTGPVISTMIPPAAVSRLGARHSVVLDPSLLLPPSTTRPIFWRLIARSAPAPAPFSDVAPDVGFALLTLSSPGVSNAGLGGRGSAVIDGRLDADEWAQAGRADFFANVPEWDGGGVTPAILYVMNDDTTLYLGLAVKRTSLSALVNLFYDFDNDNDGAFEAGDDVVAGYAQFSTVDFRDSFKRPCQFGLCTDSDTADGGTADVTAAAYNDGTWTYVEIAHGFSQDSAHDIAARPEIGLSFSMNLWSVDPSHCNFGNACAAATVLTPGSRVVVRIVGLDTTPPIINASATNADGTAYTANTWTNQNVTVRYHCSDTGSGLATCATDQVFTIEGVVDTTSGTATDNAGNAASASFGPIKIDKTAPTITFVGNAGTYTVDQMILITCSATDALSGLATSTCPSVASGTAASFVGATPATTTTMIATATDNAGNGRSAPTSFTVTVTADAICRLTSASSIGDALCAQLQSIAMAPNTTAKAGKINAFDELLGAQSGKAISADQAALLGRLAHLL
jgi:hypothetical protein